MTHLLSEEQILKVWRDGGFVAATNIIAAPVTMNVSKALADAEHQAMIDAGWKSPEAIETLLIAEQMRAITTSKDMVEQARREAREEERTRIIALFENKPHVAGGSAWAYKDVLQALKSGQKPEEPK
jgi:hypothetical protein